MRQVLVIGGSGYLGTGICSGLHARGVRAQSTYATVRPANDTKPEFEWCKYQFPADDPAMALSSFDGDTVIVAARIAGASNDLDLKVFERNFELLVEFLKDKTGTSGRLVYVSSDAVFSGDRGSYTEEDAPNPVTDYGRRHATAEEIVRKQFQNSLIVRPSFLYGYSQTGVLDKRWKSLQQQVMDDKQVSCATRVFKSPSSVKDAAELIVSCALNAVTGTLHLPGTRMNIFEFYSQGLDELGLEERRSYLAPREDDEYSDTSLVTTKKLGCLK